MPLGSHRKAPPPPLGGVKNISSFQSHVPNGNNNNGRVISRPTVIRPSNFKKKPPPRPAPPKNFTSKISDKSPTPDLLADLRDIFTAPANPAQPKTKPNNLQVRPGSMRHKKAPAPARPPPSALSRSNTNQASLIDFDFPSTPAHTQNRPAAKPTNSSVFDLLDLDPFFSRSTTTNNNSKSTMMGYAASATVNNPNATKKVASTVWTTMMNNPNATKTIATTVINHSSSNKNPNTTKTFATAMMNNPNATKTVATAMMNNPNATKSVANTMMKNPNGSKAVQNTAYNVHLSTKTSSNASLFSSPSTISHIEHEMNSWGIAKETLPMRKPENRDVLKTSDAGNTGKLFSPPEPQFPPPPPPPVPEDESLSPVLSPCSSNCKALYDFMANDPDELSFQTGDVIGLLDKPSEEWWLGTFNGEKGLFPANFVEVLDKIVGGGCFPKLSSNNQSDRCFVIALYTFQGEQNGDLPFAEGDDIEVLHRINQNWLFGKCKGQEGQFPANFVQKATSDNNQENENSLSTCTAKYQFQAENGDELSFEEGDRLVVLEKLSADWWKGYLQRDRSKRAGIFPSTFVDV